MEQQPQQRLAVAPPGVTPWPEASRLSTARLPRMACTSKRTKSSRFSDQTEESAIKAEKEKKPENLFWRKRRIKNY